MTWLLTILIDASERGTLRTRLCLLQEVINAKCQVLLVSPKGDGRISNY